MPSGYTAKLHDGTPQTPKDFITNIATAFGIGGERDYGDGSHNIERERKYLKEALVRLAYLESIADDELAKERRAMESYFTVLDSWVSSKKNHLPIRLRYERMKRAVEAWDAQSEGGKRVKEEAIDTLDRSIDWDCSDYPVEEPTMQDPDEWYTEQMEWANRRFLRAQRDVVEAIESHERAVAFRSGYEADLAAL